MTSTIGDLAMGDSAARRRRPMLPMGGPDELSRSYGLGHGSGAYYFFYDGVEYGVPGDWIVGTVSTFGFASLAMAIDTKDLHNGLVRGCGQHLQSGRAQHGGAQEIQRRPRGPRRRDGGADDGADVRTHGRAGVGRGGSRSLR